MKTRKEQLEIELAFENGKTIEYFGALGRKEKWTEKTTSDFNWHMFDYRIKEEPKRVPFDVSDGLNLLGQKFKLIESQVFYSLCTDVDEKGVYFGENYFKYDELMEEYEKWNDLLKVWEECSKVA